ncbi:MAG: transposase [Psychromonas sp.]|jgi:transposase
MKTTRQYKTYTSEFKTEALALISEQGYSVQEAASALGITTSLLYSWEKKAEDHVNSTVNSDERTELLSLRKEVKQLRMEKEILKKTSAFFAKEMK